MYTPTETLVDYHRIIDAMIAAAGNDHTFASTTSECSTTTTEAIRDFDDIIRDVMLRMFSGTDVESTMYLSATVSADAEPVRVPLFLLDFVNDTDPEDHISVVVAKNMFQPSTAAVWTPIEFIDKTVEASGRRLQMSVLRLDRSNWISACPAYALPDVDNPDPQLREVVYETMNRQFVDAMYECVFDRLISDDMWKCTMFMPDENPFFEPPSAATYRGGSAA